MDEEAGGAMAAGQEPAGGFGPTGAAGTEAIPGAATEAAAVRAALLAAYPRAIPELVGGETVGEVLASLEVARAAWERVAAAVTARPGDAEDAGHAPVATGAGTTGRAGGGVAPAVPAGAGLGAAVDPERLPTTEKIRRGLAARGR